jgi:hypothetical protein
LFTKISLDRLYVGSIYKLTFLGLAGSLIPMCLLSGFFALFGANTVRWNGQPIHGVDGLLLAPVFGMIFVGILSVLLGTSLVVGLWLYSKFLPISLWAKNVIHLPPEVV